LIIDPGGAEKRIINFINYNNLNVVAILNTHAHYDHVGAINKLKDEFSIPLFLHSKDEKLLETANLYAKLFDGIGPIKIPTVDYYFDQIDIQDYITSFSIKILITPGHTLGSVCLLIEGYLFTGDTLFNGKIGRVDLPGGDGPTLNKSLNILSKLPNQTTIYPGHGTSSTIGHELKYNNSFIQALQ
jgi:hydroxyacylglutathione hydrolase